MTKERVSKNIPGTDNRYETVHNCQEDIAAVFRYHEDRLAALRDIAAGISAEMKDLSAFIEQHTAVVCPECRSVCCINLHSYHTFDDIVYLYAREEKIPRHTAGLVDSDPCQFLGKTGCSIQRDLRPYRCNWYFCTPLLDHIVEHNSCRHYRCFINLLERITGKRQKMMEEYASVLSAVVPE